MRERKEKGWGQRVGERGRGGGDRATEAERVQVRGALGCGGSGAGGLAPASLAGPVGLAGA